MASKKYKLLLGILTLMATSTFAQQSGSGYSVFDSTVIPSKRLPQQNEFWNNTYNFPAKPRNMWEVGVSTGIFTISGDVPATVLTAPNFGIHVRKAFGYVFSMRLQYINTVAKGQHWLPSYNYNKNPAFASTGYNVGTDPVFYNYKTKVQDLGLQGILTLNNIRFHKNKTGVTFYMGAGIGATVYEAKVNALDENGNTYASVFQEIASSNTLEYKNRKDILDALKDKMDDSYETPAENQGNRRPKMGDNTLKPSGTVLGGMAFKLSKRVNLAIEDRITFVKDDLLDGQRWQESNMGDAPLTRDYDSYNYLSLGVNFNLGGKSVEPLWWINPLDYAYSELNNPKHMKLPKPVLDDTDGDGVTDQFDREPNTPAGAPVDTHGVSKDTDGDGVPDYKDKQLITPTECQPVDADGVGKCPDPKCCENVGVGVGGKGDGTDACAAAEYPSISFKAKSVGLSGDAKALLATVASKLKDSPDCSVIITGYPGTSKAQQSLSDKRLEAVKKYLVETLGISSDRIATDKKIDGGDENIVDIKSN